MPGWPMQFDLVLVVHVAMALSLLELAGRCWHAARHGHTNACLGALLHLGAGLCLMLALREALMEARAVWLLVWLSASGAAHLGDIFWHRRRAARPHTGP